MKPSEYLALRANAFAAFLVSGDPDVDEMMDAWETEFRMQLSWFMTETDFVAMVCEVDKVGQSQSSGFWVGLAAVDSDRVPQIAERRAASHYSVRLLELPTRAQNVLLGANIKTLGELARLSERALSRLPGSGPYTVDWVLKKLPQFGMSLAPDGPSPESLTGEQAC